MEATIWGIRALQGVGYGFFLVPASIIAYSQLRPDQNNKASSLTNLFRNWGGSFGIAFITTASERRANFHQMILGSHLAGSSQSLQQNSIGMISYLMQHGFTSADASGSIPRRRLPATIAPKCISGLHGLLPRNCVADDHNDSFGLSHSQIQRRRLGASTAH